MEEAGPLPDGELERFLESFFYVREGFLVDAVERVDPEARAIEARLHTARPLPYSDLQRSRPGHPAHVAAAELLMATGSLGCLHAWLFHGCRWEEGWAGFGNRIHRADFRRLVRRGPALALRSRETRARVGERRIVLRLEFAFYQEDALVYAGDQSAMFVKGLDEPAGGASEARP